MTHDKNGGFYGPPLAGKTTILHTFHEQFSGDFEISEVSGKGPRPMPDRVLSLASSVNGRRIVLRTLPGSFWNVSSWEVLFRDATDVVGVLDGQSSRLEANLEVTSYLSIISHPPLRAFLLTKFDLAEKGCEMWDSEGFEIFLRGSGCEIGKSRSDRPDSILDVVAQVVGI